MNRYLLEGIRRDLAAGKKILFVGAIRECAYLHSELRDDDGVARVFNTTGALRVEHDSGGVLTYTANGVGVRGRRNVDVLIVTSRVRQSPDFNDLLPALNREGELVVADL